MKVNVNKIQSNNKTHKQVKNVFGDSVFSKPVDKNTFEKGEKIRIKKNGYEITIKEKYGASEYMKLYEQKEGIIQYTDGLIADVQFSDGQNWIWSVKAIEKWDDQREIMLELESIL